MEISVEADIKAARRKLLRLANKDVDRAAGQALNKVASSAKTQAVRSIAAQTGLKQKSFRQRVRIWQRANANRLHASVRALPFAPNLILFRAKRSPRGVIAQAWRKTTLYRSAFFIRPTQGGAIVAKRTGVPRGTRGHLEWIYGPSVPSTFVQTETDQAMKAKVRERWPLEFDRALRRAIERFNRKRG